MGAKLSLLAPSAPTIAISSYVDILSSIQYVEVINNSRFLKTIKAIDQRTGCLIIVKVLIKPSNMTSIYSLNLQDVTELIVKESSLLASSKNVSNVLPWSSVIETDRAGYLIRQYCKTNLYDRLSIRSFLQPIEKVFLMYQMIRTINELHNLNIHHGDLRLENFLVTSWNWLLLTDFSAYTKPVFIPEDNPNQFSFYFDSSGRRVCYLAPERFINNSDAKKIDQRQNINDEGKYNGKDSITNEMDSFSLGCVIAELFMDGEPVFTLSSLFKYIRGEYVPDLSGINNLQVKEIITRLISTNPSERPSCQSILDEYRGSLFPEFFGGFLYDFMSELNDNDLFMVPPGNDNYSVSDLKLEYIYSKFGKISTELVYEYLEEGDKNGEEDEPLLPLTLTLPGTQKKVKIRPTSEIDNSILGSDSSLIIVNLVYSLLKTLKRPSSKIKACELILLLSERINDECKLDRSLPYLCYLLDEYLDQSSSNSFAASSMTGDILPLSGGSNASENGASSNVASFALRSITTLLMSCLSITPLNTLIFPEYLVPKFLALINSPLTNKEEKTFINISIANCLPYLATVAKRFWLLANNFKNDALKSITTTAIGDNEIPDTFNISKDQLDFEFENLSLLLLTDSSPLVKLNLVSNILPLCQYFGIDKTNDIILPHLITFLNDPDTKLRLCFLDSLLQLGPYVGVLSFEQYLLPLLLQTLCDLETFVILKVLEIFNKFIDDKLINLKSEFNALNIYNEILSNTLYLILHPNEWIRQSVLNIILSVSVNLSNADKYCFLFPLIKTYLSYDIATFDWTTLYPCLTKPLTKPIFELAITWSVNATSKSLFWKQSTHLDRSDGNSKSSQNGNGSLGRSVYAQLPVVAFTNANGKHSTVPLSAEDKQWLFKLKSIGLEHRDLWKIFMLRDFIYRFSKSKSNSSNLCQGSKFELINHADLIPRNVFFELCYKSEPIAQTNTLETRFEQPESNDTKVNSHRRGSNSLILPNFSRAKASVQTVQENVFGELESSNSSDMHSGYGRSNHNQHHHHHVHSTKESNSTHKVFSVNNQQVITAILKHSYTGYNPFILNFLQSIDFTPNFDNFSEFGPSIRQRRNTSLKIKDTEKNTFKGVCVSQINTNIGNGIDTINSLAICESSEFFVTGSDSGYLRVWDTSKLEKNLMVKNANLILNLGSSITCIKFIPKRFAFAVSTMDGFIRVYKVEVTRNKTQKILKYNKCSLIRDYRLNVETTDEGYIIELDFMVNSTNSALLAITSTSKIIEIDVIKMERVFSMQNPLFFGIPTTFIVDLRNDWLLLGTNKGYLCLWDLRFELILKSWEINTGNSETASNVFPVKKLVAVQKQKEINKNSQFQQQQQQKQSLPLQKQSISSMDEISGFAMIGGTGESDITIWDIPTFTCTKVLSSQNPNPRVKLYTLQEHNSTVENGINKLLKSVDLESASQQLALEFDQSMTFLSAEKNKLYCATADKRIIIWKLDDPENSLSLNYEKMKVNFTTSAVNLGLVMVNERLKESSAKLTGAIPKDLITGIVAASIPFDILLTVDRNGYIYLYQ